jgi:outer membrane protein TolC
VSAAVGVSHAAVDRGVPRFARNRLMLAGAALTLAGCASLSPDAGFPAVQTAVREHLPQQDLAWPRDEAAQAQQDRRIDELLAQPLTADGAVQLALLNNRGLQAAFQDLGISEADLVQAGRLPNPGFRSAARRAGTRSRSSAACTSTWLGC